jgi:PPOX class probable FMN-dependent enzyme
MTKLKTEEALRALYGDVSPRAAIKVITTLDHHCRKIIAYSPFYVIATSDGRTLDVSPKGDAPGSVKVADDKTLLMPDWPGNRRIDGMLNIIQQPKVAVLFIIPNMKETLRVNGTASIHDDPELLDQFAVNDKRPITVMKLAVDDIFSHCPKAFIRANLWAPESWPDRGDLPTLGEMIRDHARLAEAPDYPSDDAAWKATGELY